MNLSNITNYYHHTITNFNYERNDTLLLKKMNFEKPKNWEEETKIIEQILLQSDHIENSVVLFIGGFEDCISAYLYRTIAEFREKLNEQSIQADIFYREHDELHGIKELFALYHKKGKNIIIVAHSWGACSAFKQFWQDARIPIDLLISLDPVGLIRPKGKASHIKKWINVYIDYKKAPFTISNTIARIGQPYGKRENADKNILTDYNHQEASKMFFSYAFEEILMILK